MILGYFSKHAKPQVAPKITPALLLVGHEKTVFIDDIKGLKAEQAYRLDKKADINNLTCGGLYKMHVAKRHLNIATYLGMTEEQTPFLGSKAKKEKGFKQKFSTRYFGKDNVKFIREVSEQAKPIPQKAKRSRFDDRQSYQEVLYIPISSVKNDRTASSTKVYENPLGIYDKATELYISGQHAPSSVTSTDTDSLLTNQPSQLDISLRKKTANYNQRLNEDPSNIDLWLEFVKFQDEITVAEQPYERSKHEIEMAAKGNKANMDIKIAIIEKALVKNPSSLTLRLKQLEMCKDYWEKDKLKTEWKKLVFTHTNNPDVWRQFLNYQQSIFSSFSVSSVIKTHGKCISTLKGVLNGTMQSHQPLPGTLDAMLGKIQVF